MRGSLRLLAVTRPVVLVVILALYMSWTNNDPARMALFAVSAAFFVASSSVLVGWIRTPRRTRNALVWLEIAVATSLNWVAAGYVPGGPMQVLYMPIVMTIALDFERRQWVLAMSALTVAAVVSNVLGALHHSGRMLPLQAVIYSVSLVFIGSVGVLIHDLREERERSQSLVAHVHESQAALERTHRQLQESVNQLQEIAVVEERQRLAREIHDSVAHSLTALVVQLQAGNRLLERAPGEGAAGQGPPREAAAIFLRCEGLARECLQETRRAVRALHPGGLDEGSELAALERLGRDFSVATGIEVRVAGNSLEGLCPDAQRIEHLYRIFQEALTNAHRHGEAKRVEATLSLSDAALHLCIRNDGLPPKRMSPGVGLRSMADRARALGGSLRLEPSAEGLAIHVIVPVGQDPFGAAPRIQEESL